MSCTERMGTKGENKMFSVSAGLGVAAFSLFAALWVNGNIPPATAIATSLILGLAVFIITFRRNVAR